MQLFVDTHIRVDTKNQRVTEYLKETLTKRNPVYSKLVQMGKPVGEEPRNIEMWHVDDDDRLCIPRGTGKLARNAGRIRNEKVTKIIDTRFVNEELIDAEINFHDTFTEFKYYQERMIDALAISKQGVGVGGCGSGKTVAGLGLIAKVKQPTLVVVHTKELQQQWLDEVNLKLKGNIKVGQIGAGKRILGDITICLIQTLRNCKDSDFEKLNARYGMVIFDECHRAPAKSYINFMSQMKSRYLIGLTATPKRKDGLHFLLKNYVGPVVSEITDKEVEAEGRLVGCEVRKIETGYEVDFKKIGDDWIVYNRMIANAPYRDKLICGNVSIDLEDGFFPMILINRVKHGWKLTERLRSMGLRVGVLMGAVDKDERRETVIESKKGNIDVLVCNWQIAGEGLDIPNLDSLHLTYPVNNEGNLKQFVGRTRRAREGKTHARCWDYRDYLYYMKGIKKMKHSKNTNMFENRDRWYKKWGFTIHE